MSEIPTDDLLAGERILSAHQQLESDDPIFDPKLRPSLASALERTSGRVGDYRVPFASGSLEHHAEIPEQNLFRCLFGRDSLIISSLLRDTDPNLSFQTVCALAEHQGATFDSLSEEEPGRIAHEVRDKNDPQAIRIAAEAGWRFPYYGSVDATLLWLIALEQLCETDNDILELEIGGLSLASRAELATEWILARLESGGGVIRSNRSNPKGILNQVWKDSGDSFLTRGGEVATESQTAAVETIGDCFDALLAASKLAERSAHNWSVTPSQLLEAAESLRRQLIEYWWLGDHFAMGLGKIGGRDTLLDALASNQWRLLDSSILLAPECDEFAKALIDSVTDPDILGPSGLRTLSKSNPRYRAGGYHTGSSWPMDATLVARGLLRHGATNEALEVGSKTLAAIDGVGGYPEFFRSDDAEKSYLTRWVIDAWDPVIESSNRICQPPQLLQGWTIAAYQWLQSHGFETKN